MVFIQPVRLRQLSLFLTGRQGTLFDHPRSAPFIARSTAAAPTAIRSSFFHAFMVNYHCVIKGCNADVRKKANLKKYPWMVGVTFHSFPHKKHSKLQRNRWMNLIRREKDFRPTKNDRVCSLHFVDGGPSKENPHPSLFPWNNYGKSRNERCSSAIKKKEMSVGCSLIQGQCSDSESEGANLALPLDLGLGENDGQSTLDLIPGAAAFEGKTIAYL